MSAGHHHGDERAVSALADEYYARTKELVEACVVDASFDIPWLANRSRDGGTVYRDRRCPRYLKCGIDTNETLPWHELGELLAMNDGMSYDKGTPNAHGTVATPLERRAVEAQKPDDPEIWHKYTDELDGYITECDDAAIESVPTDIDLRVFADDDRKLLEKVIAAGGGEKKSLYVSRNLLNAADLISWAKDQGFGTTLTADDMHVTVAYSRDPVDWSSTGDGADTIVVPASSTDGRSVEKLGDKGAVVLRFESPELTQRWQEFRDIGASWDWPGYKPHVTITYDGGDLTSVEPYVGALEFGPEEFAEINENWADDIQEDSVPGGDAMRSLTKHLRANPDEPRDEHGRWTSGGGSQPTWLDSSEGNDLVAHASDAYDRLSKTHDKISDAQNELENKSLELETQEENEVVGVATDDPEYQAWESETLKQQEAVAKSASDLRKAFAEHADAASDEVSKIDAILADHASTHSTSYAGSQKRLGRVERGNPDEPRDEHGRWTSSGGSSDQLTSDQGKSLHSAGDPSQLRNLVDNMPKLAGQQSKLDKPFDIDDQIDTAERSHSELNGLVKETKDAEAEVEKHTPGTDEHDDADAEAASKQEDLATSAVEHQQALTDVADNLAIYHDHIGKMRAEAEARVKDYESKLAQYGVGSIKDK